MGIGPRDLENGVVELARRDTLTKEFVAIEGLADSIPARLEEIQQDLLDRASARLAASMHRVDSWTEFEAAMEQGGFVMAHWDGSPETEERIKELTKATIRCIPIDNPLEDGACVLTGRPSIQRVLFARAY
jgi:prolyl-tRNA synthetase